MEGFHQGWKGDGQLDMMSKPTEVFQGIGNALEKMRLALIKASEAIGSQGLHDADVNVRVVVLHEGCAVDRDESGKALEIVVK
jgi:hypothetical protein